MCSSDLYHAPGKKGKKGGQPELSDFPEPLASAEALPGICPGVNPFSLPFPSPTFSLNNIRPNYTGAPAFLFVRNRSASDPAIVQIP